MVDGEMRNHHTTRKIQEVGKHRRVQGKHFILPGKFKEGCTKDSTFELNPEEWADRHTPVEEGSKGHSRYRDWAVRKVERMTLPRAASPWTCQPSSSLLPGGSEICSSLLFQPPSTVRQPPTSVLIQQTLNHPRGSFHGRKWNRGSPSLVQTLYNHSKW